MEKIDLDYYERVIIFKSLTDEVYLSSIIDHIKPAHFNDKSIRDIIEHLTDYYTRNNTLPSLVELRTYMVEADKQSSLKQVGEYIQEIKSVTLNSDELYKNTERFLKEKSVYNTLLNVIDSCKNQEVDTSSVLDMFEKACNISLETDLGYDLLNRIDDHIRDITTVEKTLSVGWEWLDEKLDGGLLESGRSLYVFAGETNVGKSIVLGNIGLQIAKQGKKVLIVSLEMSEKMYSKRLSSSMTQIPISTLATNHQELKEQLYDYKNKNQESRILVKEFPPNTITVNHLKGFIKKVVDSGIELDCIVVDYVNLLHSNTGSNSYERVKDAAEKLRALSYEFECPIVTATQLNRQGYNQSNPSLDTVSESIGLAATADAIFGLWQEEEDAELGIIRLGIMKNRFGANYGSIAMRMDYTTLTLTEDPDIDVSFNNDLDVDAGNTLELLSG